MRFRLLGSVLSPFVRKVRVTLLEKGVDYELEQVVPFLAPDSFTEISPLRRVPVLLDNTRGPHWALPDSSAICQYLERENSAPALYPSDSVGFARALWMEEYGDTEFSNTIGLGIFRPAVVDPLLGQEADRKAAERVFKEVLPRYFQYLEKQIGSSEYFVGASLTLADISIAVHFQNLKHAGFHLDELEYPGLAAFVERTLARPSFLACRQEERSFLREHNFQIGPQK